MRSNVAYQRSPDTAWRTIIGETIVVHLQAKEFFGLNESAAVVWNALDGKTDVAALSARHGIAREDVAAFCTELQEVGLVEAVDNDEVPSEDSPKAGLAVTGCPENKTVDPPRIVWREEIQQVAATCAFLPAQNPLCTQVPMS